MSNKEKLDGMKAAYCAFILIENVSGDFRESHFGWNHGYGSQIESVEGQRGCDKAEAVNIKYLISLPVKRRKTLLKWLWE